MKLPYIILADSDSEHADSFVAAFEEQVPYALVHTVSDGKALLAYLSSCKWSDVPSLMIVNYRLNDMTAPDLLRQVLMGGQFAGVTKVIWSCGESKIDTEECRMLGVKHILEDTAGVAEVKSTVRIVDGLLRTELNLQ